MESTRQALNLSDYSLLEGVDERLVNPWLWSCGPGLSDDLVRGGDGVPLLDDQRVGLSGLRGLLDQTRGEGSLRIL